MGQIIKTAALSFGALLFGAVLIAIVITAPIGWALVAFSVGYPLWKINRFLIRGSMKAGLVGGEAIGKTLTGHKENTPKSER
jgi:uncharacterized membrane protein